MLVITCISFVALSYKAELVAFMIHMPYEEKSSLKTASLKLACYLKMKQI